MVEIDVAPNGDVVLSGAVHEEIEIRAGELAAVVSELGRITGAPDRHFWCRVCRPQADAFMELLGYCYEHAENAPRLNVIAPESSDPLNDGKWFGGRP